MARNVCTCSSYTLSSGESLVLGHCRSGSGADSKISMYLQVPLVPIGLLQLETCPNGSNAEMAVLNISMKMRAYTLEDFQKMCGRFIDKESPSWFTMWMFFLYPSVFPVAPDTVKAVLTAKNIPKSIGLTGAHRMLKPWIGDGLLVSNGKKWERNRRLLTPAFHFEILKPYVDIFNDVAGVFLDKIKNLTNGHTSIDIYPMVSRATLDTMLRCTLSFNDETVQDTDHHHPYVVAIQRLGFLIIHRVMTPWYFFDSIYKLTAEGREFQTLCDYVHKFSEQIIKSRQQAIESDPSHLEKRHLDFLDILITAKDGDGIGLTEQEIRAEVDTFMFAGHDTTASAISWAILALAKYPDIQEKVRQEVEQILDGRSCLNVDDLPQLRYTTSFIKETMRMYTPVPALTRQLIEPLTIQETTFPPGQIVDIHPHLLHHNPAVWDKHTEFKPERFLPESEKGRDPFAFLPFSAGQRNCIGQHFAMNEMKIFVTRIVARYNIKMDPDREAIPYAEIVMRAKNGIYLYFEERDHLLNMV